MHQETVELPFAALFENPPLHCRGLDVVHNFRQRRSYRDIWHHLPADATRTWHHLQGKQVSPIWYGPHAELDPDQGIRGDLFCILSAIPRFTSNDDLDALVRSGIGGLAGNVAWSPAYPYDEQDWNDFLEVLAYCRQHGLELWFYDEAGYPSGHANQRTLEGHPEYLAQGLRWTQHSFRGPGRVTVALPTGDLVAVVAVAEEGPRIDGARQCQLPLQAEVSLPEGCWRVFAFASGPVWAGTHADGLNIRYPNLLDSSAVRRFLEVTHETYYRRAGAWFGNTITGVFTDEPSLMSPILPAMDDGEWHLHLPWVSDLPEIFQQRTGYALAEALPALIADIGQQTGSRRCAYWETVAQLLSTRCHRQIGDWCASHGIAYTGHLLWEECLHHHVILHGDLLACLRWFGWPGYDALFSPVREEQPEAFKVRTIGAKYVSSAAHLYGKPHTMCETFGLTEARPLAMFMHVLDVLVLLGLERHGFYSLLDKLSTEERLQLNIHLGRVVQAGFYGRHRCEIALLYPIVAAWAAYDASQPVNEQTEVMAQDAALATLVQDVLDRQLDFDFCDDDSLQHGHAEAGRWQVGQESYRIVLVPPMAVMRQATLDTLALARRAGVVILFTGPFPRATVEHGPDVQLEAWCAARFAAPLPTEALLDVIPGLTSEHVTLQPENRTLWMTHRQAHTADDEWSDIYLIVNTAGNAYHGHCTLPGSGTPYWCEVQTGRIISADILSVPENGVIVLPLDIDGYGVQVLAVKS